MMILGHDVRPFMASYLSVLHILGALSLTHLASADPRTLILMGVMYFAGAMGITAGVHRLWAHRSYKAALPVRVLLLFANAIANQGSIYHWARDHRVHHKHSDTDADPHNSQRGLFYSHMGWLLVKKHQKVFEAGKTINMDDLKADPVVMFQLRTDPWLNLAMCFAFPTAVATVMWGESAWTAFLLAGVLKYLITLHCTWCVNSLAHFFGDRPYANIPPAENRLVALITAGEGWHNWHHKFPYDYAASEFGVSAQFNPTKLFIDGFAAAGLVWGRKRATQTWASEQERVKGMAESNRVIGG